MKKIIFTFISCLMLACIPMISYADKKIYVDHDTTSDPSGPKRGTETDIVTVGVNEVTCELSVTCNDNVPGLHVTLTKNGITYEEDTVNAVNGQTLVYNLGGYDNGVYELTIEAGGSVISVYTVTIMDD